MEISIEQLRTYSKEMHVAVNKLLKQLDSAAVSLTKRDIEEMLSSSANYLFIATRIDTKEIVGMITLIVYRIPVWKKAWIEDLVVDERFRNKGIAKRLIHYAIEKARDEKVLSLNLTSHRTKKTEGNKLYQALGFKKRNTNVYRILI